MPKSAKQLEREIAEALQRKGPAKPLYGKLPAKAPPARHVPKLKATALSGPARTKTKAKRKKTRRAHSTKNGNAREKIEELIASDDPEEWNVARDLAIQKNITDMIVLLDMSRALGASPSELTVTEDRPHDNAFEVRQGRHTTYVVVPDEDVAYEMAVERVTDDLKSEPELFSSSFVESHIDQKKLKEYVFRVRMDDDYVEELADNQPDDFWRLAERFSVDVPEPDEDGDMPEPSSKIIREVERAYAEDAAENPMSFFEDMYGSEAVKYAVEAVGIDEDAAAKEAVDTDGWERWLASDGSSYTTDSGLLYWRT